MAAKSKKQVTPESESSSSSRSTSPESVKGKTESKREPEESSSSESEEEGSSSSSESESAEDEDEKMDLDQSAKESSPAVAFHPPQAFKPPTGFKSVKKQSASSNTSSILSNLRGKQVLHITAPAYLPLSKVKEVSLAKVMQGEPVLKHDGVNYGIPADSIIQGDQGGKALLLYDSKTQTYYKTPASNIQSYHVQELITLPETLRNDDPVLSAAQAQSYTKPPRKQPKHLKMRFRPVGSGEGPAETLGSSSESEGEKPTFKFPKGSSQEKEERKRKHREGNEEQPAALPRKKSKKQSASQEDGESRMDVDEKKSKKSSKSKDEKKRRKTEKA